MTTSLQKLSSHSNSWRKFSLKKILVLVLFFVVLVSFTIYAYAITVLIPVGILPFDVVINPITNKAYVAHGDGTVHVINTLTNIDIKTIIVSPGNALTGITVHSATNKIYVANAGANEVAVIDGVTDTLLTTIPLVSPLDGITQVGIIPVDVEVNTNLCTLYVSNVLSLTVVVINLETVCNTFPTGLLENQIIDVLQGTENASTDDFRFDSPARFTFDPTTNLMYMTNFFKNEVSVLDGSQNAFLGGFPVLPPIETPPGAANEIEINLGNRKIYVADAILNKVIVIEADTSKIGTTYHTIFDTIDVGLVPIGIGIDELNNRIYVGNKDEGTLSVIDGDPLSGAFHTVIKTIPTDTTSLTPRPKSLDVSGTGLVYVVNSGIGSVVGNIAVINFADPTSPIARAGPDQVVNEGDSVTLDGVASSDSDGDALFFTWTHVEPFGPGGEILTSSSTKTSFTAPQVNSDTLLTFLLTVTDSTFLSSISDVVRVIVSDEDTFSITTSELDGVISGSENVGNIFAGSTYALQIDGSLPSAELEHIVIPTGVTGTGVTFDFTESSIVPSGVGLFVPNIEEVALLVE